MTAAQRPRHCKTCAKRSPECCPESQPTIQARPCCCSPRPMKPGLGDLARESSSTPAPHPDTHTHTRTLPMRRLPPPSLSRRLSPCAATRARLHQAHTKRGWLAGWVETLHTLRAIARVSSPLSSRNQPAAMECKCEPRAIWQRGAHDLSFFPSPPSAPLLALLNSEPHCSSCTLGRALPLPWVRRLGHVTGWAEICGCWMLMLLGS